MKATRPVLRYHGGKWKLAPWIISYFPDHETYTEAFGGGASVLLQKDRAKNETYNDLYGQVVSLFRILRDPEMAERLRLAVALTPFSRKEFCEANAPTDDPIEEARRILVRSYQGFGTDSVFGRPTGFRSKSRRSGTSPAMDWANWPVCVAAVTERLRGVVIENATAAHVLRDQDSPTTLHYVDPPYVHSTRRLGGRYPKNRYAYEMTDDDHRELAEVLRSLAGMVVLSGYANDLYADLYGDWTRVERSTYADGARPRTECLWLNPATVNSLNVSLFEVSA